jgi:hypothetical protein
MDLLESATKSWATRLYGLANSIANDVNRDMQMRFALIAAHRAIADQVRRQVRLCNLSTSRESSARNPSIYQSGDVRAELGINSFC